MTGGQLEETNIIRSKGEAAAESHQITRALGMLLHRVGYIGRTMLSFVWWKVEMDYSSWRRAQPRTIVHLGYHTTTGCGYEFLYSVSRWLIVVRAIYCLEKSFSEPVLYKSCSDTCYSNVGREHIHMLEERLSHLLSMYTSNAFDSQGIAALLV